MRGAADCAGAHSAQRWMFSGELNQRWHQNTVGFGGVRRGRRVSMTPGLHDLRHFYASGLIVAGCDVVTVQRALGHQSAVVTLSTYGLLWPRAEDRTRAAAASLMASATSAQAPVRPQRARVEV
jgi:integrase